MKGAVKIAVISAAAAAVILVTLFVVIPLASSKGAEAKLDAALAEAGIHEDLWNAKKVYYVPLFGDLVLEDFEAGGILEADKITMSIKTNSGNIFAGSIDAQGLSFSANGVGIAAKNLSVKDFSVDKTKLAYNPLESIKKIGRVSTSGMTLAQDEQTYFTLESFNANIGYSEGEIPLSTFITLKKLTADLRSFNSLSALRPEYRLSKLELKNSLSGGTYRISLIIDMDDLFLAQTDLGISFPQGFDGTSDFSSIDYEEDVKLDSLVFTYTDKSFLEHIFELTGMPGGRENAAELFNDSIVTIAELGSIDAERLVNESSNFFKNPGKLELKTNFDAPMSFEDLGRNPLAANLSLSINGGKPFTSGGGGT